jgi:hypothetical protein
MAAQRQIGPFTIDDNGDLWGPDEYMEAQGHALLEKILAGEDMVFNTTALAAPDMEAALLRRMHDDYAGWQGIKQAQSWLKPRLAERPTGDPPGCTCGGDPATYCRACTREAMEQ